MMLFGCTNQVIPLYIDIEIPLLIPLYKPSSPVQKNEIVGDSLVCLMQSCTVAGPRNFNQAGYINKLKLQLYKKNTEKLKSLKQVKILKK